MAQNFSKHFVIGYWRLAEMSNSTLRDRRLPMKVDVNCSISKEQANQFAMTIYDEMAKYL